MVRYETALRAALIVVLLQAFGCSQRQAIYLDVRRSRTRAYLAWTREKETGINSGALLSGELSLERAVLEALAHSKVIREAVEERTRGRGRLWQGYSEALPKLSANASYYRLDEPTGGTIQAGDTTLSVGDESSYSYGFILRQPLFRGGAIAAAMRAAEVFDLMADEQVRSSVEKVMHEVCAGYLEVLLAQRLHEVYREAQKSAEGHLDEVSKRRVAGLATEFEVLRAEVEASNVQAEAVRQDNKIKLAFAALLNAMGASQRSDLALITPLQYLKSETDFDTAVGIAYENRADLGQAELEVRMQEQALRQARAGLFPSLDAFVVNLWSKPDPHDSTKIAWGHRWYGGVALTWNVFDGLRREGQIVEQGAILRQRKVRLEAVEEQVLLELKQALVSIQDAERLIDTQELNVEHAREGLELATKGYPEVATLVEVTDARAALVRAWGLYWQAVKDHCRARLDLQKGMGLLAPMPGTEGLEPAVSPAANILPPVEQEPTPDAEEASDGGQVRSLSAFKDEE